MFREQVIILRDVFVIKIRDAKIEQDIQQKCKSCDGIINTERTIANCILHFRLNDQYPKRLDQQVQAKQDQYVDNEFLLHQ